MCSSFLSPMTVRPNLTLERTSYDNKQTFAFLLRARGSSLVVRQSVIGRETTCGGADYILTI